MSKLILSLTAALFMTCGVNAQRRMADAGEPGVGGCGLSQRTEGEALQRSVEDVDLRVITPSPDGGVMVGGSVYANDRKGLILRNNGRDVDAVLIPKVVSVDELVYTTKETGWRLYAGTLYATSDGGVCWRKIFTHKGLTNIHFTDPQNGWLAGLGGVIYRTGDAGRSWHRQDSGTDLNLIKLSFIDPLHGWALGTKSVGGYPLRRKSSLIRTQDGGRTWETLTTEETVSLTSFSFVSGSEGWGIDWDNNVVHTVDGGRTWGVQHRGDERTWRGIFFMNPREGWVVGDGMIHTADGGATWRVLLQSEQPGRPSIQAVYFSDSRTGWAVRTQELLYTSDAGLTWNTIFKDPRIASTQKK